MAMQLHSSAGGMQSAQKHLLHHICNCGAAAGAVAEQAEVNKQRIKYINTLTRLDYCHFIILVAKETAGVFGPRTTEFLKDLGHRIKLVSGEANSC